MLIRGNTRYLSNASVGTQRTVGVIKRVALPSKIVPSWGMPELGVTQSTLMLELLSQDTISPLLLNHVVIVLACCCRSKVVALGGWGSNISVAGFHW